MEFLYVFLTIIHVIVCIFLVIIVLLQPGRAGGMGAAFGGSSQTVFGARGAGTLLARITAISAAVFMITSMALAYIPTASEGGYRNRARHTKNQEIEAREVTPTETTDAGTEQDVVSKIANIDGGVADIINTNDVQVEENQNENEQEVNINKNQPAEEINKNVNNQPAENPPPVKQEKIPVAPQQGIQQQPPQIKAKAIKQQQTSTDNQPEAQPQVQQPSENPNNNQQPINNNPY